MRSLLVIFSLALFLNSAQIDNTLFENRNNAKFYEEIEKKIEDSAKKEEFSQEIINTQKVNLKRLKEIISRNVVVEKFDNSYFTNSNIDINTYFEAITTLAKTQVKIDTQNSLLNDMQNRLVFLKKSIEDIVEENKHNLLSYQLQYAYYRIQKSNIELRIKELKKVEAKYIESLFDYISKIKKFDIQVLSKDLEDIDTKIKKLIEDKTAYEIELEKESIEENSKNIQLFSNKLESKNALIQEQLEKSLNILFKQAIFHIKNKKEKELLKVYSLKENRIDELSSKDKNQYEKVDEFIKSLAKKHLGNTKLFLSNSLYQSQDILKQAWGYITSPIFVYNEQAITLFSLIKAVMFIVIGFAIGLLYKKWLMNLAKKWPNMSQMSIKLSSNVGFYIIVIITFMITMSSLGIDMSSISLIAGALSIGIGFGLQTVVSNLIAGIILMFERTIRIGDIIEINDLLKGTVTDIRIRSTTIKTFDNIDIVVPNSSFIQNNVINWTLEDPSRRLHIPFGVAYGTKIEKVKEVVLEELKNSDLKYIKDNEDKKPEIRLENMNTSSVDLELLVWIKANDKLQPNSLRSDFLILIYNALYKHDIEIPFPQLDLHIKKEKNQAD
ncbi:mechanosensitive ion channel domain-containing protein [Arcobacter sp. YIC-464]|uniref:mechanosensitive ion channel domain-containing protein n=1 Tax=Arcobacter sp. YIC-464 TaxID=3376631 RepID=UPI003C27F32C